MGSVSLIPSGMNTPKDVTPAGIGGASMLSSAVLSDGVLWAGRIPRFEPGEGTNRWAMVHPGEDAWCFYQQSAVQQVGKDLVFPS